MATNPYKQVEQRLKPTSWIWSEHGDMLTGKFAGYDEGSKQNEDGSQTEVKIALVETEDGTLRSLWLFESDGEPQEWHLRPRFEHADPQEGDFVSVRRNALRQSTTNPDRKMRTYDVAVMRASMLATGDDSNGDEFGF